MKRFLLFAALAGMSLCVWVSDAQAQELDAILTVASGSGISIGGSNGEVSAQRSPLFMEIDVGLIFDRDTALEWTPGLIFELENTVSFGVNPSVKRILRFGRFGMYGTLGLPFFLAPFTLLGVEAGVGGFFKILPQLDVALEWHSDVFFWGSDLPKGSILAKMDLSLGLRVSL